MEVQADFRAGPLRDEFSAYVLLVPLFHFTCLHQDKSVSRKSATTSVLQLMCCAWLWPPHLTAKVKYRSSPVCWPLYELWHWAPLVKKPEDIVPTEHKLGRLIFLRFLSKKKLSIARCRLITPCTLKSLYVMRVNHLYVKTYAGHFKRPLVMVHLHICQILSWRWIEKKWEMRAAFYLGNRRQESSFET
jgi:hypothetical protein